MSNHSPDDRFERSVKLCSELQPRYFVIFDNNIQKIKDTTAKGAWQKILEQLAEWSVLFNALVMAMTTDFIPKMVNRYCYSDYGRLNGYVNNSLSFYNTSFLPEESIVNYHKTTYAFHG